MGESTVEDEADQRDGDEDLEEEEGAQPPKLMKGPVTPSAQEVAEHMTSRPSEES